jgi:hypothetical protein
MSMNMIKRAILALAMLAGIVPAFAQVPPPVPALPDTERRTSYSISASTCACSVGFQLYGDSTDVVNWLEVFVNGVLVPQSGGWTISSPTGPIATIPRPITDAVLTFTTAQTGTVQIVGARRPRRTSQFQESQPVPTRNFNQTFSDIIATQRELWDKTNDFTGRSVRTPPGETLALLPILASRANMGACFDGSGNLTSCVAASTGSFIAGAGIAFTGTNPTTISAIPCSVFTSISVGCVPASGGGGSNFLRADGVFAPPPSNYQPIFNITSSPYNAVCNFVTKGDVAMASGSATATSASGWTPGDVGKNIIVSGAGANIGSATTTVSNGTASIAAVNSFAANQIVVFTASVGSNLIAGTAYYISATGLSGAAFQVTAQLAGVPIVQNGNGSPNAFTSVNLVTGIASFINSTTVTLSIANTSGAAISGRQAEYSNDDTTAINSAIAAAVAAGGGTVYIPANKVCGVTTLNMTNINTQITLTGEGVISSRLMPIQNAGYGTLHGHIIDLTGSSQLVLQNFQVGLSNSIAVPQTGLFMAQTAANQCNHIRLRNLYISGNFSGSALYDYGCPSWEAISSDFYNYSPGAGNHMVAFLTATNGFSYTSNFATVTTGFQSTSDIHFFNCEFHKFGATGSDNFVLNMDGTTNVGFYGGVINGGASAYVGFFNTVAHISFFNTTFENEGPPTVTVPTNAFFKSSGTVTDLNDLGSSYANSGAKFNPAASTTAVVTNAQ